MFSYASKHSVIEYAENLLNRLLAKTNNIEESNDVEECGDAKEKTFEEVLNSAIKEANECTQYCSKSTLKSSIRKELKFLEGSSQKVQNIEFLFNALLTIRPTSVESERAFSVAGLIVNKTRSRLFDGSINALSVLKIIS